MDYKKYLKEFEGKSPSTIKAECIKIGHTLIDVSKRINEDEQLLLKGMYYIGLITICTDNSVDAKEIKLMNDLNAELNLGRDELTPSSAKAMLQNYSNLLEACANIFAVYQDVSNDDSIFNSYSSATGGLRLDELFIRYMCAIVCVNGDVDESETDLIESFINGTMATDDGDGDDYSNEPISYSGDVVDGEEPPRVIKVGGTLYKDTYNTYFSVGAEIEIKGSDVNGLDIRVQLLDSTGFILESYDERISWVERGIFHFGKEYNIECNPSNFKVIVGARERGNLNDDYRPSLIFKCSGMRFMKNSNSYDSSYDLACMVENIRLYEGNPETDVYVTFYDQSDNIVGGAQLSGNILYLNQPDRYDSRIDCKSVISKTYTFRWTCDLYFIQ